MSIDSFFEESTEQSAAKAEIVAKYFWAWAKVIISTMKQRGGDRLAYIDLFAGPGRYESGKASTPLLVLERAIVDPDMSQRLVTIFNDVDTNNTRTLEAEIRALPGIEQLRYQPEVANEEVGTQIVERFEAMGFVPTLLFVDPWGYKGLSLRLVNSVLRNWGCDCIFFFNFNRINMGLGNPAVKQHMDALFGEARAEALRARLEPLSPMERELVIVEEVSQALRDMGGNYVLPFRFKSDKGHRTSHYLIFVSKHPLGYQIMKDVMAGESTSSTQGVPSFEYSPATVRQPLLFELARPLDDLADMLLRDFAGQCLTMDDIYARHNIGRPYIQRNYKAVLAQLESEGKIQADPPADRRPMRKGERTFAGKTVVTFPPRP